MSKNSFLHPVNQLRLGTYRPEDVELALTNTEVLARSRTATIIALPDSSRTYDNTVQALLDSTDEFDFICHVVGHMGAVDSTAWQKAETLTNQRASAFYAERSLDEGIYKAVKAVQGRQDALGLTAASKRLLDDIVVSYERGGVALPPAKKTRLKAIKNELSTLSTRFGQNDVKARDQAHLHIKTKAELAGIDADYLEEWHEAAKAKGLEGYYVQYSAPVYDTIMKFCDHQPTRRAMHKLARGRAAPNAAIGRRMLALRREFATLLGFKNYADYITERRMAKTGQNARDFINSLTSSYTPAMRREASELLAYIRQKTGNAAYQLDITDVDSGVPLYWSGKMRAELINLDESKLREYFTLSTVLDGFFDVLHTLYGITFQPSLATTYRDDVQAYDMHDETGAHLATVWCDWFARPGKRAGAWEHTLYVADRAGGKTDEPHLAFVNANLPTPTKTKPSLLDMRDVETIWHEFGHFIHAALGRTELREQNGYECTWDFIEAPSQIMENWVWQDEVLSKIARHYKTGEPMPAQTIAKLRAARSFRAASTAMWTLSWSSVDLALHIDYDPATGGPITPYYRTIKSRFFPAPIPAYDKAICTFTHIFDGGYAAAYYGYKWAESIEADFFSRFQKEGILNPATGRAYRDKVLARGDQVDAEVLVYDFLGRASTTEAMLTRDGIVLKK